VGDKPGKYWDHRECGWVRYSTATEPVAVPAQAGPDDAEAPRDAEDAPPLGSAQ